MSLFIISDWSKNSGKGFELIRLCSRDYETKVVQTGLCSDTLGLGIQSICVSISGHAKEKQKQKTRYVLRGALRS